MPDQYDGDIYFGDIPNYIDPAIDVSALPIRPEEELLSARVISIPPPKQLSALAALQQLARVSRPEDIGTQGPVMASSFYREHATIPELRLYEVLFGRDALVTALFLSRLFPELAKSTVVRLAELQGVEVNEWSEEEVGKIVHEARDKDDPFAKALTERYQWQWPYYASVDATPLFIQLVAQYVREQDASLLEQSYTDRRGQQRTVADAFQSALAWIYMKMDQTADGLIESPPDSSKGGTANHVWKDSYTAYHHHDGTFANKKRGVASVEVQGYAYDALLDAIDVFKHTARPDTAAQIKLCSRNAERLKHLLLDRFWVEDERGGYFALGSDRDDQGALRLLQVRSSNMGHLLHSRLLDGDDAEIVRRKEALVRTLFSSDMLNISGIRTLSTQEYRFRANSYHNGSVWPWDTHYISLGLLRHGYTALARELMRRTHTVFTTTACFPEFLSGAATDQPVMPTRAIKIYNKKYNFQQFIEQPPQRIQAWSVAAAVDIENRLQGG